jgi:hypothetical protein
MLGIVHPLKDNPFLVLELPPDCSPMEIERQGKKLLGMLELDLEASRTYGTPLGRFVRTPEKVRESMAVLRDPARRGVFAPWALAPREVVDDAAPVAPWPQAFAALWWHR